MSVDFRHLNRLGEVDLSEVAALSPLIAEKHHKAYLANRFPIGDLHYHRYRPKPNEPDDAVNIIK